MTTTYLNYPDPIINHGTIYPGSAMLGHKLPKGGLKKGQIAVFEQFSTGLTVNIISSGKAYANESAQTSLQFFKNHSFYVGGSIYDKLGATLTVTAIDNTTSDLYDTITVNSAATLDINVIYYDRTKLSIQESEKLCFIVDNYEYDENIDGSTLREPVSISVDGVLNVNKIPNYWSKTLRLSKGIKTTPYDENSLNEKPYKTYVALLTQSSTDAPTAVVLKNELSAAIVYTYTSAGLYPATLVGAFTENKTAIYITNNGKASQCGAVWVSADVINISSWVANGTATDALLTDTTLEIRVYQ